MGAVSHLLLPQVSTAVFSVIAGILVLALLFL
jgi:hypothetical protein